MNEKNIKKIYILLIAITFTILVIIPTIIYIKINSYEPCNDQEFLTNTLTPGIKVLNCKSEVNDNFFHVGTYFILEHDEKSLNEFLEHIGAGSYEDYSKVDEIGRSSYDTCCGRAFEKIFKIKFPLESIGRGYEIEKGRDDWLLVDKTGKKSYFTKN